MLKNRPQKLLIISANGPAAQTSPELIFHVITQDASVLLSVGKTISTHFGAVSPLSIFSIIQPIFLQKN